MAIYDSDGTALRAIGKIYDDNGTTLMQLGRIYDNNGTTNSLTYTAVPPYLYDRGDQYPGDTGGWVAVSSGCHWYNQHTWQAAGVAVSPIFGGASVSLNVPYGQYIGATIRTALPIDLTDITALTARYDTVGSGGDTTYISTAMTAAKEAGGSISPAAGVHTANLPPAQTNGRTMTLDCSALTGSYYIYIGAASGGGNYINMTLHAIAVQGK